MGGKLITKCTALIVAAPIHNPKSQLAKVPHNISNPSMLEILSMNKKESQKEKDMVCSPNPSDWPLVIHIAIHKVKLLPIYSSQTRKKSRSQSKNATESWTRTLLQTWIHQPRRSLQGPFQSKPILYQGENRFIHPSSSFYGRWKTKVGQAFLV